MSKKQEINKLEVMESLQEDIDKGIARIPSHVMDSLKLVSGDIIEIKSKNATVVKVMRALTKDNNKRFICLDGTIRSNIGSSIGEKIVINLVKIQEAKSITLAPVQEGIRFSNDPTEFFHTKLMNKPLVVKQKTVIDIFGTRLNYIVSKVSPKGYVIVTPSTKLIVTDEVHEGDLNATGISYEDIGGLRNEIELVREMVELPMKNPEVFQKLGVGAPKGILLTGPPGTGKTLLAKAVATETNANFISVKGPELISKWVGESEKHVREIFKKARQVSPSIIFFDEFDSISKMRGVSMSDTTEKVVNQLLTELDGIEELEKVIVLAATNRKDLIDSALIRPGRIDSIIELKIPDKESREEIFKVHTKKMPLDKNIKIIDYAKKTESWTGADIESMCRNAGINAIKRYYKSKEKEKLIIKIEDFEYAFNDVSKNIMPSTNDMNLDFKNTSKLMKGMSNKAPSKNEPSKMINKKSLKS